jgi:hypothetical protein
LAIVAHLEQFGPETVGSLARATRRLESARRFPPKQSIEPG